MFAFPPFGAPNPVVAWQKSQHSAVAAYEWDRAVQSARRWTQGSFTLAIAPPSPPALIEHLRPRRELADTLENLVVMSAWHNENFDKLEAVFLDAFRKAITNRVELFNTLDHWIADGQHRHPGMPSRRAALPRRQAAGALSRILEIFKNDSFYCDAELRREVDQVLERATKAVRIIGQAPRLNAAPSTRDWTHLYSIHTGTPPPADQPSSAACLVRFGDVDAHFSPVGPRRDLGDRLDIARASPGRPRGLVALPYSLGGARIDNRQRRGPRRQVGPRLVRLPYWWGRLGADIPMGLRWQQGLRLAARLLPIRATPCSMT